MIYDVTQLNNELDLLEIRLNILDPYVDYFVIGESKRTFQNREKPLHYWENRGRFAKWNHKIIHIGIPARFMAETSFERAAFQKDYLRNGLKDAEPEDVIYYGDVDEIWTPQEVGDDIYKLRQLNYSYYLDNRSSEDWQGTNVFHFKDIKDLNEIRADHSHVLEDGGWHFTNMGGYDRVLEKLESYDHAEFNTEEIKAKLKERMENNEDYVGRELDWQGKPFSFWQDDIDLPKYLKDNKTKWKNLFLS